MLRAVTFDYWGTLVDADYSRATQRFDYLSRHLRCAGPEQVADAYRTARARFDGLRAEGIGPPVASLLSLTLDALGEGLRPDIYTRVLGYWQDVVLEEPPEPLPGAMEALRAVRAQGLYVGLISDTGLSTGRVLRLVLQRAGMLTLFDTLTFSDEIGVTKRCRQPFVHTLHGLGVPPRLALHVGDQPETDIRGAQRAGLQAALLLQNSGRRDGVGQADYVLETMDALPELAARLAAEDA
ncbi:MAG: HAD family hydrolase [Anaerolineae bacterium]